MRSGGEENGGGPCLPHFSWGTALGSEEGAGFTRGKGWFFLKGNGGWSAVGSTLGERERGDIKIYTWGRPRCCRPPSLLFSETCFHLSEGPVKSEEQTLTLEHSDYRTFDSLFVNC